MKRDYIPGKVGHFNIWVEQFVGGVEAGAAKLHVAPDTVARLRAAGNKWKKSRDAQVDAKCSYAVATTTANEARKELTQLIRQEVGRMRGDADVPESELYGLGLPKLDRVPTPVSESRVIGLPTPLLVPKSTERSQVRVHYLNPQGGKAKPKGIQGVAIYCRFGGGRMHYLATTSKTPYTHTIDPPRTVVVEYKACWVDSRGRQGAFCDPVKVAVTG